jgi:hypothetical protein
MRAGAEPALHDRTISGELLACLLPSIQRFGGEGEQLELMAFHVVLAGHG